jgi:hypothetical protein
MYYNLTMTNETPSRAAGLVTVQLGIDLKRDWLQWCVARDLVPGKALRSLVEQALAEGLELSTSIRGERVKVVVATKPDEGSKVARELRFTPSEDKAIEAVAKAQGFGFQDWVVAATRAALAKAPSYGQAELEALTASNAQLAQVAIELRALRSQLGDQAQGVDLAQLEKEVRIHVEAASKAMARGAQRWQLKI